MSKLRVGMELIDEDEVLDLLWDVQAGNINSDQKQKYILFQEYYRGDQTADYEDALALYNRIVNVEKGSKYTITPTEKYQVFYKLGPFRMELMDEFVGRYKWYARCPVTFDLTKNVIDAMGCSFNTLPSRTFKCENKDVAEELEKFAREIRIDAYMGELDKASILNGVAGLLVEYLQQYDDDGNPLLDLANNAIKGDLRLTLITPEMVDAILDPLTQDPVAVMITYPAAETIDAVGNVTPFFYHRIYTKSSIELWMSGGGEDKKMLQRIANPMKCIPIVWMRDCHPTPSFWGRSGIGDLLVRGNLKLNQYFAQLEMIIKYQTSGMKVAINMSPDMELTPEPDIVMSYSTPSDTAQGEIKDLSPNGNINGIVEGIKTLLGTVLKTLKIPPGFMDIAISNSSLAVIEQRAAMRDFYLQRQPILDDCEKRLWALITHVKSVYGDERYSTYQSMELKWRPWPRGGSDQELNKWNTLLQDHGGMPWSTTKRMFMEFLDMDEKEAEAYRQECLDEAKDLAKFGVEKQDVVTKEQAKLAESNNQMTGGQDQSAQNAAQPDGSAAPTGAAPATAQPDGSSGGNVPA